MESKTTFPKSMRFFHHIGMILIFIAYLSIYILDVFPEGSIFQNYLFQTHIFAGLLVLFFVIPRFIFRIKENKNIPPINPPLSKINSFFAETGHVAIYILMILIPISGWLIMSADTGYINLFGIHIPGIIAQNYDYSRLFHESHELLGILGLFLILGHGGITLIHHFKIKDNTLVRMFPWIKQKIKK